jgi:UDP-N-acetylmuramoyl-tripeptide--D-alanyl-D-alanine ligase
MATAIPENSAHFTIEELCEATGGTLVRRGTRAARGISTDTRAALEEKAFVALVGERFDGHDLLEQAVSRGASCLIVERDVAVSHGAVSVIRVSSTLRALGDLARFHRRRWGGRVVAIAGSAGKTTTRSAVSTLLESLCPGRVHATRGNLNNRIGLPLTVLGVSSAHEVCVLEVGTNQTGEVPELAAVCEPDVAVLTLVDLEHSEGLGSLDEIEAEEGALLRAVGPDGAVVGNVDDPRVRRQLLASRAATKLGYGTAEDAAYRIALRRVLGARGCQVVVDRAAAGAPTTRLTFTCPLLGEAGALAATAALAVAERVTGHAVEAATLTRALAHVGEAGRLALVTLGDGAWVLDDSYNSNPGSVKKSVETARELAAERSGAFWLVLGEMRELGPASRQEHEKMGILASESGARGFFAVGGDARLSAEVAEARGMKTWFAEDAEAVVGPLTSLLESKDVVLVKASRGVRAERVVEGLVRARGRGE